MNKSVLLSGKALTLTGVVLAAAMGVGLWQWNSDPVPASAGPAVEAPPTQEPTKAASSDLPDKAPEAKAPAVKVAEVKRPEQQIVAAGHGDTLMDVLLKSGVSREDAQNAIEALQTVYDPKELRVGQKVTVTFDQPHEGSAIRLVHEVSLSSEPGTEVTARRNPAKGFAAQETHNATTTEQVHYAGTIRSSLYETATSAGVPANTIVEMIKILSYDVDFQRDIQPGDSFELLTERQIDKKGQVVRNGNLLYASVTLSGDKISLYRYADAQGLADYYNSKGESVKKALLKTPVDGAKITSSFGMRNHPILGFSMMHKGVDFGVPTGTPIMAAGTGIVAEAGFHGSYGNYVKIRHNDKFSTAYAHMSRFAQGIHGGSHVTQGQVIGFVGATGRATGAHLHYEVLIDDSQVNPLSVKLPTGIKLAGKELGRFQLVQKETANRLAQLPVATKLASAR